MKITKKEFENLLCNNRSLFYGVTKNKIVPVATMKKTCEEFSVMDKEKLSWRTATQYNKGLRFSNGSILETSNTKYENRTCYKEVFENATMLYCVYSGEFHYYGFEPEPYTRCMYYLIEN